MFGSAGRRSATGPGNGETPGMAGDWSTVVTGLADEAGELRWSASGRPPSKLSSSRSPELTARPAPRNSTAVTAPTSAGPELFVSHCFAIKVSLSELRAEAIYELPGSGHG